MARSAALVFTVLFVACGSGSEGVESVDGGAPPVTDAAADASPALDAEGTAPDATSTLDPDASTSPPITCGDTTCRADQVCVDARECRATSGFCCGGVDAGPCEPATIVPHCADVPATCGDRPTCECLPTDVCDVEPGTRSPYGCGFVDSQRHVACLAA